VVIRLFSLELDLNRPSSAGLARAQSCREFAGIARHSVARSGLEFFAASRPADRLISLARGQKSVMFMVCSERSFDHEPISD
jgi:hypothetical protein